MLTALLTVLVWLVHLGFMARAILRPHRDPASRFAWVIVMAVLPLVGIVAYLLLGRFVTPKVEEEARLKRELQEAAYTGVEPAE